MATSSTFRIQKRHLITLPALRVIPCGLWLDPKFDDPPHGEKLGLVQITQKGLEIGAVLSGLAHALGKRGLVFLTASWADFDFRLMFGDHQSQGRQLDQLAFFNPLDLDTLQSGMA